MFGITAVRYGVTRSRHGMSLGDVQDVLFLSSLGEEDFQTYVETGVYRRSPHHRWLAENDGAISLAWFAQEAKAGRLLPDELEVQKTMEKAG